MASEYICLRCGSPVIPWRDGWKHANGGRSETRSCGKPPRVTPRAAFEREMQGIVEGVRERADSNNKGKPQ